MSLPQPFDATSSASKQIEQQLPSSSASHLKDLYLLIRRTWAGLRNRLSYGCGARKGEEDGAGFLIYEIVGVFFVEGKVEFDLEMRSIHNPCSPLQQINTFLEIFVV